MTTNVLEKGILVKMSISCWGATAKIENDEVLDTNKVKYTARDKLKVTKTLIDKGKLKDVRSKLNAVRAALEACSLPTPLEGVRLVPHPRIEEAFASMNAAREEAINEGVAQFAVEYPALYEQAKNALGDLFDATEYPMPSEIRSKFDAKWVSMTIGPPDDLPDAVKQAEHEKFKSLLEEATKTVTGAMRSGFAELIDRAVEKLLGTREDKHGEVKPQIFRDSLIENLRDFIDNFNKMNIANDAELEALVEKSKKVLTGNSVEDIRTDDELRAKIAKAFQEVQNNLDGMMVDRPTRKVKTLKEE